jgi:hypothetical protein
MTPQEPVYSAPPPVVYQSPASYGQQVYGQTQVAAPVYDQYGNVVQNAPVVGNAPVVPNAPTIVNGVPTQVVQAPAQVVQAPPSVVYMESAPRVVYVPASPRVVYAPPPVISFGFGYRSGPRYGYSYGHHVPFYRSHGRH